MALSAAEIRKLLGLQPHPTCGFVSESFRATTRIPGSGLPAEYHGESRPWGSVLYFMVTPEAHIRLHRIRSDQMYHHYQGDPLEVLLLYEDGRAEKVRVGHDLEAGERPQLLIPGRTFHISRLVPGGEYALLGTSEWPGVEPPDVELGDPAALAERYPEVRDALWRLVQGGVEPMGAAPS